MTSIAVFGAHGMLGRKVVAEVQRRGLEAFPISHADCDISVEEEVIGKLTRRGPMSAVINCAGTLQDPPDDVYAARANMLGPHILSHWCRVLEIRLIHVSTDCVFAGNRRLPYRNTIADTPSPPDFYGLTKYAGEPRSWGTTVRTSFIGLNHGLLAWILAHDGAAEPVPAWRNAMWTGSTVGLVAEALVMLATETPWANRGRIVHLATMDVWSKAMVIELVRECFGLKFEVEYKDEPYINRALTPTIVLPPLSAGIDALVGEWRA